MSTADVFSSNERRKNIKKTIKNASGARKIRFLFAAVLSIIFLIVLPIVLVLSPFILAWEFSGALVEMINNNKEKNKMDFPFTKWGVIHDSIDSWKEEE